VVVLDGASTPLPVALTRQLLQEPMRDHPDPFLPPPGVSDATLDDAVDEMLFLDGGDAGAHEQPRFERTLEQLERFMSDRILILVRRQASATSERLKAEAARDAAIGAAQRDHAELALRGAQVEIDRLDAEIARLRAGEDDNYQRWRRRAQDRRYAPPTVDRLVDAEFEVV
jgi:hypothetical protein